MTRISAVGRALPDNYYGQDELIESLRTLWAGSHHNASRLDSIHRHTLVGGRRLALPLAEYARLTSFTAANDAYIVCATDLGTRAAETALEAARLRPANVDYLFFVSTTGVATPSVDARIVNRLGLRADVKRSPLFGLGCVGGAAALARAADALAADPGGVALVVAVELCSLTLQRQDLSIANVIATGLFGDGAAAVVLEGAARPCAGPRMLGSRSCFYPNTERVMGWDIGSEGLKIVLSADVPAVIEQHVRGDVDRFLAGYGLTRSDLSAYICHPGGPRVLEAVERSLELEPGALVLSWRTLRELGNLSSASVLLVLGEALAARRGDGAGHALVLAMGPGFCCEMVLLGW